MTPIDLMGGVAGVLARLGVATLIGSVLGLNRELHGKPAGLRIHALVCLGSALITVTSVQLAYDGQRMDGGAVVRAIQGLITGIGFLGGGVILRDSQGKSVHGLTTAATIWIAAGLGIVCGAGQWPTALIALGLTLAVLIFGGPVERFIHRLTPPGEPPSDLGP
jgi:putative Mg2+ transporter-C (MgtC) family protein